MWLLVALVCPAFAATLGVCPESLCEYETIGAAVAAAKAGDLIEIRDAGTYAEAVTVSVGLEIANVSGGLVVWTNPADLEDHALLVTSPTLVTVKEVQFGAVGDGLGRRIRVDPAAKLKLLGGGVHGGSATSGGGVYVWEGAALTVDGTEFVGNAAGLYGGAIKAVQADVDLIGAAFTDNRAAYGGAMAGDEADLTDVASTWTGNSATDSGGSVYLYGGAATFDASVFADGLATLAGGDIVSLYTDPLTLTDTVHDGARSELTWGGAIASTWGSLEVDGGTFTHNSAYAAAGAIEADFVDSVVIRDSTFFDNDSVTGGAIYLYGSSGPGGAVELTGCTFERNAATDRGGAVQFEAAGQLGVELVIADSVFLGNTARCGGGLAAVSAETVTVTDARFEDNEAVMEGAGVYALEMTSVTLDRVHLCRNSAGVTGGGALLGDVAKAELSHLVAVDNEANQGGALHLYGADAAIDHVSLVGNRAPGGGAALAAINATVDVSHAAVVDHVGIALFAPDVLSDTTLAYDLWFGNDDGDADVVLPKGELFADPLFTSLTSGIDCGMDLRPADGSPLIDAGSDYPLEADGTAQDIGAHGGLGSFGERPTGVDADGDGFTADVDCDDLDPEAHPGAIEECDDRDLDCDGRSGVDQGGVLAWADADGDGFGDPNSSVATCAALPWAPNGLDCDDGDATVHPDAPDAWYDGIDADCRGDDDFDADLDGFAKLGSRPGGDDCDDDDPAIHPRADDLVGDAIDQDCDGADAAISLGGGGGCGSCATGGFDGTAVLWLAAVAVLRRRGR